MKAYFIILHLPFNLQNEQPMCLLMISNHSVNLVLFYLDPFKK